jgi:hypothetical protein
MQRHPHRALSSEKVAATAYFEWIILMCHPMNFTGRFAAAEAAGVIEVDFWSDIHPQDAIWWSAIRRWKRGGGSSSSWACWAAAVEKAGVAAAEAEPCAD